MLSSFRIPLSILRQPVLASSASAEINQPRLYASNTSESGIKTPTETGIPLFATSIADSKAAAVKQWRMAQKRSFCVSADASVSPEGQRGVAAVRVKEDGRRWASKRHFGKTNMKLGHEYQFGTGIRDGAPCHHPSAPRNHQPLPSQSTHAHASCDDRA